MPIHSVNRRKVEDHSTDAKDDGPHGGRPYYIEAGQRSITERGAEYCYFVGTECGVP